jgi:hypothetical protein
MKHYDSLMRMLLTPNVTVRGRAANESETKPPNLDKKTELQNRQRAARPFD